MENIKVAGTLTATLVRAWCGCWMVVKVVVGGTTAANDCH